MSHQINDKHSPTGLSTNINEKEKDFQLNNEEILKN
jgi:hypothetical protein